MEQRPPIYTLTEELLDWTLERTAGIPKAQRFTFGQRLDNTSLELLRQVVRALFTKGDARRRHLSEGNLLIEELRVLWRSVEKRGWIGQRQLLFVNGKLDEIGRMAGGWMRKESPTP